jgi:two-component system NtrC family response regulator
MRQFCILIVDDEESQRESIAGFLKKKGYKSLTAPSADAALKIIGKENPDLIISDYSMPGKTGGDLLDEVKKINPLIPVILVTAYGTVENAVEIMKNGAFDYIQKPIELKDLLAQIAKAEKLNALISENLELKKQLNEKYRFDSIVSNSPEMENAINMAVRVAKSKASVLIHGESGSGKELIARALHYSSDRADKKFIVVNCAALPDNLFESELFGYEKGAFTGADKTKEGKFELADGGTLFLDEVGEIPIQSQAKLLRALQFGEVQRLGGKTSKQVDVRIVAATNRNLEEMIKEERYREDLYYRFNVVTIELPSLRSRKSDIPHLVDFFLKKYADYNSKPIKGITKDALNKLMRYDFPGNVRELENIMHRAVALTRGEYICIEDLPETLEYTSAPGAAKNNFSDMDLGDLNVEVDNLERTMISKALDISGGSQVKAAAMLNISERTLRYKMQRLNLK